MSELLRYKGYSGRITLDEEQDMIHGHVMCLKDVVNFRGKTAREAVQAFHDSVDDYLEFCKQRGEKPDPPG
jgi:predicted HicB family RNase H-like nuclease